MKGLDEIRERIVKKGEEKRKKRRRNEGRNGGERVVIGN